MYRFLLRPSWVLLHVTVVATIVLMINLGLWQFDRYHERLDFNEIVSARIEAQPKDLNKLLLEIETGTMPANGAEWLNVFASGEYLDKQTVNAVNRSQGGFSGVDPLTPMRIAGGNQLVLVNRGFIAQSAQNQESAPAPVGTVEILGRVRVSEVRKTGGLSDPSDGVLKEVINIDLNRLGQQIQDLNTEIFIEVLKSNPADSMLLVPIADPILSSGSHLSYTAQWFIFSVFVAAGWVVVVRRKLKSS
jgi:cytochrome oxidase assembly protein ShyY1